MHIVSFAAAAAVPEAVRAQIGRLHDQAWPPGDEPATGPTHDPLLQPVSMVLLDEDDRVVAALDILRKDVSHAGRSWRAGGLSTVVTDPDRRGRGHGTQLVAAAHDAMPGMGLDLGLFTCDRPLQEFYVRAGWVHLPGTVLIGGTPDAPFPSDGPGFDKVTIGAYFTEPALAQSAAFRDARIALYPGDIDRLW